MKSKLGEGAKILKLTSRGKHLKSLDCDRFSSLKWWRRVPKLYF
jgi:hypothetical protein